MTTAEILPYLQQVLSEPVLVEEPLAPYTTWKLGGPAKFLVTTQSTKEIVAVLEVCRRFGLKWTVMGNGSNILVPDQGFAGVVVILGDPFRQIVYSGTELEVGAGVLLPNLVRQTIAAGYTGLEFAAGIPGTVGGAVVMNAGAHGQSLSKVIRWVDVVDDQGRQRRLGTDELLFGYRTSVLKQLKTIVCKVGLVLERGNVELSKQLVAKHKAERKQKQPLDYPNAGSVFKNPPGDSAGRLIEALGCKGLQVGKAMVSEKHANFIVNLGGAKSSDVLELINIIREKVSARYGIDLETEVLVLGE